MANKDPRDNTLVIPIFGETTWELVDNLFISTWEYIKSFPETDKFVVMISSQGGDRDAGWSIYEILRAFNKKVITVGLKSVSSSAIYPFIAGHKRYVFPNATFLFHPTVIVTDKDEERPLSNYKEDLMSDNLSNGHLKKILKEMNVPQRIIRKMEGKKEHFYLTADKAVEYHFADEIITSIEKPWEL